MDSANNGEIILYQTEDGLVKLDVKIQDETVWLSKNQMAELFQRDRSVISMHIKNVFDEGELSPESNVQILNIALSDKPTWTQSKNWRRKQKKLRKKIHIIIWNEAQLLFDSLMQQYFG